jgi:hypothetical protein
VVTDRGFASSANSAELENAGTFDALCPRSPEALQQRMKERKFRKLQKRLAQTEARIGILKANFLGQPMRAGGFENRELALGCEVLTHNLWVLARMRKVKKAKPSSNKPRRARRLFNGVHDHAGSVFVAGDFSPRRLRKTPNRVDPPPACPIPTDMPKASAEKRRLLGQALSRPAFAAILKSLRGLMTAMPRD